MYQFDGQGNFSATGSFVGGTNPDDRATRGTWQTNGTTLNLLITCGCSRALAKCAPVKLPSHVEYTSTTGELVYFMDYVNGGVMVQRYAKR